MGTEFNEEKFTISIAPVETICGICILIADVSLLFPALAVPPTTSSAISDVVRSIIPSKYF